MSVLTPAEVAERWKCSEHHVRKLIAKGELRSFKLGERLLRVKSEWAEEFECRTTQSAGSEENSSLSGMTPTDGTVTSLAPETRAKLRDLRHHSMQR